MGNYFNELQMQLEKANEQRIKQLTNGYFIKIDLQDLAYQPQ